MDDTFVYLYNLPSGVGEVVLPCADGYTIYINESLSNDGKLKAYRHAMSHIRSKDFDSGMCADEIERARHESKEN